MVIAIILTAWVGFSTILSLAFVAVAARRRPLAGEDVTVESEPSYHPTTSTQLETVGATT